MTVVEVADAGVTNRRIFPKVISALYEARYALDDKVFCSVIVTSVPLWISNTFDTCVSFPDFAWIKYSTEEYVVAERGRIAYWSIAVVVLVADVKAAISLINTVVADASPNVGLVNTGDVKVLFVKVSTFDNVERVPLVGKVTIVFAEDTNSKVWPPV